MFDLQASGHPGNVALDKTDPGRKERHEPRGERGREEENKEGRAGEGEKGKIGKGAAQTQTQTGGEQRKAGRWGWVGGRGSTRDKGQEEGEEAEALSSAFGVRAGPRSSGETELVT